MPTPRLDGALGRYATPPSGVLPELGDTYSEEVVEGAAPAGQFVVRGHATPTRSGLSVTVGDRVVVLFRRGLPFMIVNVQSRKGPGVDDPGGLKIVEVLFIADDENGDKQVWFRNATVLANLRLRSSLPNDPEQVRWGARGDSFWVRTDGSLYHAFKFNRPGGLDAPMRTAPSPELLRAAERPWTGEVLLASVAYSADVEVDTPAVWFSQVETFEFTGDGVPAHDQQHDTVVHDGGLADVFSRSASASASTDVRLTEASVTAGDVVVYDVELDFEYSLVVTVQAKLFNRVTRPGGNVAAVADKSYSQDEQPIGNVISTSGDPDAQTHTFGAGASTVAWQAPKPDDDWHSIVVNVTKGAVLWSSAKRTANIAWDGRLTDSTVAVASDVRTEVIVDVGYTGGGVTVAPAPGPVFPGDSSANEAWAQSTNTAIRPTQTSPPANPDPTSGLGTVVTDPQALQTHELGDRNLLDAAGLAWMSLPLTLSRHSVSSVTPHYGTTFSGFFTLVGTLVDNVGTVTELYLQTSTSDTREVRKCQLLLYPVRYLPRRTKAGGDLYIFAVIVERNDSGGFVSQQTSLWRYATDTGKAVAARDWTVEDSSLNFFEADVIGATLRHVLWVLKRGRTNLRWTVILADATNGSSKDLVDATAPNFSTVPPAVQTFLDARVHAARPDVLYSLEGATTQVKDKFVKGWSATEPTMDAEHLAEEGRLRGRGALKSLGSVAPEHWSDGLGLELPGELGPSVRVLESRAALGSLFVPDP